MFVFPFSRMTCGLMFSSWSFVETLENLDIRLVPNPSMVKTLGGVWEPKADDVVFLSCNIASIYFPSLTIWLINCWLEVVGLIIERGIYLWM